jgi:ligand-binding sensor protein
MLEKPFFSLQEIVPIEFLQEITKYFNEATGCSSVVANYEGKLLTQDSNTFNHFCTKLRQYPEGRAECERSDAFGGLVAASKRKPYIYRCHMGVVVMAVPIVVNDHYLGVILNGQVFVEEENLEKLTKITETNINIENYPELKEYYENVYLHLPVMPLQKFEAYSRLLYCIANYIAEIGANNIMQQQLNKHKIQLLQESNTKAELEKTLAQLELKNMQSQMAPHYLLNTLNSIYQMAILEGAVKTPEAIYALCELLRKNLRKNDQMVSIADDLEYINNYLLIKKIATRERILVKKYIDSTCLNFNIPPFTLPPLVENAFIHGLEPKEEGGTLSITVKRELSTIKIEIEDDGLGMSKEMLEQILRLSSVQSKKNNITSLGIHNVVKTLTYYFGEAFRWELQSGLGQGTKISLFVPANG